MKPALPLICATLLFASSGLRAEDVPASDVDARQVSGGGTREADESLYPKVELTAKLFYQLLISEIAAQRGQAYQAAEIYLSLARETRDPRIARRATELALHARRLDAALQGAQLWNEGEPNSPQARHTLISLLAAQGRMAELRTVLSSFLAADPKQTGDNLVRLNRLFARDTDRVALRSVIEQVTEPYLAMPEAHYARALAAFEARDPEGARVAVMRALAIKPDWEMAALLRVQLIEDRTEAMKVLGEFVDSHPTASESRMTYARALVTDKRYAEARRQFTTLLDANNPAKTPDVVFAVAVLSLQLDDTAAAERYLRQLVEIGHVESDKARFYLGQIAEEGKRWNEARQWFDQVGPGEHYLNARLHGANVRARQGQIDEARRYLADTEASQPRDRTQLLIGEAQILRDAGRLAEAHEVMIAGLENQPDQPDLLYDLALLEEKMGLFDAFEARLRRLIDKQPDHAHALNALGYGLADRNIRLPEARGLIERALELRPDDPFILDSKGWVLFRMGEKDNALAVLENAYKLRADPETAAHIGEVLWSLGRRDEARAVLDKARKDAPNNEAVNETIQRLQP
jgi:tetratricopeptide (TPR) repeat protein